ncbi:putative peroxidase [Helianthus annuus]|nr:putative peroxidase [Helianthus annuus]KAJ0926779.1 putative peroxidase [Helianthus annuus]
MSPMIMARILTIITLVSLQCFVTLVHSKAQVQIGFYSDSCSAAESIVKQEVSKAYSEDRGLAAGLVRLHFHDCFVRGCDASVLIDSTPSNQAEKDSPANNPSTGGLGYEVPAGRRDGRVSLIADTRALPPATSNLAQLTKSFSTNGLTQEEMVTLSGAHTIGRSHCTAFASRLYNFSSTVNLDPSLNPLYASKLKQECPKGSNNVNLVVPMNPSSPTISDTGYYVDVLNNRGLFTSDQSLLTSQSTLNQVHQHAMNPLVWKIKFAKAMVKMGRIGVITGQQGEIRSNCRVINK